MKKGTVFNIQRSCFHDGPGIRTTAFVKGCPISCWWCANPESINPKREIGFLFTCCNQCKKCVDVCEEEAITFDHALHIDRSRCTLCGKCVEVCYPEALTIFGKEMEVDEVLEIVKRDKIYYQSSGGGLTVSGGEPLMQPSFVFNLFKRCKEEGINTCLDSCGFGNSEDLKKMLTVVDWVLFDMKHMSPDVHKKFTGKGNELILENAGIVASSGVRMVCRIPLIPGVNDTAENIKGTAEFLKGLGSDIPVEILPYHRLGKPKFEALGRSYLMKEIEPSSREHVEEVRRAFECFEICATIVT